MDHRHLRRLNAAAQETLWVVSIPQYSRQAVSRRILRTGLRQDQTCLHYLYLTEAPSA